MRTMPFTLYVQAKPAESYHTENILDGFQLSVWNSKDIAYLGLTYVTEFSINVEIPDTFNPRAEYVKVLMQKEQALRDEFEAKVEKIREEISRFEALGYEA